MLGAVANDTFGKSVSMSADGVTIAVGAPLSIGNGSHSGHVRVFTYPPTTKKWNRLGNTLVGVTSGDAFGKSVSMSADDMTIVVGAQHNDDDGTSSGHARTFTYSSTANTWSTLGNTLLGAASSHNFGCSVSTSADGMTVAVGAMYNNANRDDSGHVRLCDYSSTSNKWNCLGNTLVGAASHDRFGWPVSISADVMTVVVVTPGNGDNGNVSGHVRLFAYSSTSNTWNALGNTLLGASA